MAGINKAVQEQRMQTWRNSGTPVEKARISAYAAKGAGKMYDVTPSTALDMQLSASEFATNVACLLGVDVVEGGALCSLCGTAMESSGNHALSCMCGGDQTLEHNTIRDVFYTYCERGGLSLSWKPVGC